jgi:hypothetical protein
VKGLSKFFGEMPWYYYVESVYTQFCEIESYGVACFMLLTVRQINGNLTPTSGNGWLSKRVGEKGADQLTRIPFVMIFFLTNFFVLSSLGHKEMRFIAPLIMIGNICMSYMITWCLDCREVFLNFIKIKGVNPNSKGYYYTWYISGWMNKFFALYVVYKAERSRLHRMCFNQFYKNDSSREAYNLFLGRSELIG